ncbi:unnamed protein product [Plutella xylostella]|uniref:(diamondback moth) hypothetical protein n=1 Tax=Plutella xylostella TaxID=51655 RepID=A0A8S4G6U4_PLUXY|nr:unnamed protein product [Plutella xylostella]
MHSKRSSAYVAALSVFSYMLRKFGENQCTGYSRKRELKRVCRTGRQNAHRASTPVSKIKTEIETMSEDFDDESDESLRERQLFELQYYGAVSAARQLLQPVSSVSTSTSSCAGSGSKPSIVKLPQISLPHFNVKAVHLELVTELTKEAYLSAMSRFVARRGLPHSIMSDQAKCFIAS